jgi:hypothetical protein
MADGRADTVTLVTGDRVTMHTLPSGRFALSLRRPAGREHIRMFQRHTAEGVSVIPADAAPLLTGGRLDPRLFNPGLRQSAVMGGAGDLTG